MSFLSIDLNKDLYEFDSFLQGCGLSDNTIRAYKADINDFLLFCKDNNVYDKSLSELEFKTLCENYIRYTEEIKDERFSSKKRRCSSIRKLNKYLYILNKQRNKLDSEEIPTIYFEKKFYHSVLSKDDIAKLINYYDTQINKSKTEKQLFKNYRNKLMFLLILNTGIRAFELINLKWSDFSLIENNIYITKGINNQNRCIKLSPKIVFELNKFKEIYKSLFLDDDVEFYYIFCGSNPKVKLTTKTIRYITEVITKKNIIDKPVSPLALRHTMVYMSLKEGISLYDISKILGHKHFCSTTELYETLLGEI